MTVINVKEMKEIIDGLFKAMDTTLLQRFDTNCCKYAVNVFKSSIQLHLNSLIHISKLKVTEDEKYVTEDNKRD